MSAPPFMPLYVGDYLSDTTHLTCTEHGAYMLLLMSMWRNGGSLPNNEKMLYRHARCTRGQWDRIWPVLSSFFTVTDSAISHKRLSIELTRHSDAVRQQLERSSNGGKAKALKDKERKMPTAASRQCQPEPEPYIEVTNVPSIIPRNPKAQIAAGFLAFWQAYPKRVGKDAAAKSFSKAMSRIKEDDPLSVILAGIERALPGWDDPQFIPNPATWLNQGRWADDAPTPRRETRNASGYTDARSAKFDHLDAISRAMAAALDRPEGEYRGHSENSDAQGRMRSLAAPS